MKRAIIHAIFLGSLVLGGAAAASAQSNGNGQGQQNGRVSRKATGEDGSSRHDANYERLGELCDSLQTAFNLTDIDVVPSATSPGRRMRRFDEAAFRRTLLEIYAYLGINEELPARFKPDDFDSIVSNILFVSASSSLAVQTLVAEGLTTSLAILRGDVTNDGGKDLMSWGFKFGTSSDLADSILVPFGDYQSFLDTSAQDTGAFQFSQSGLDRYTTYYYAAWAANEDGVVQGNTQSFTTLPDVASGLALSTSAITSNSASLALTVADAGGQGPDDVGFYWDDADFSLEAFAGDSLASDSASGLAHTAALSGLTRNTTYYFNAYADNLAGRAWAGSNLSFTTLAEVAAFDTLYYDLSVDSVYAMLADDGGAELSLSRFYYSTTDENAELVVDSVEGQINGLTLSAALSSDQLATSQNYTLSAVADNEVGRATSDNATIYTPAEVTTSALVTNLSDSTGTLHASFAYGNRIPSAVGFMWGLYPDLAQATDAQVTLAADSTIQLDLVDLIADSTYYFAAYADNGLMQFGDTMSFLAFNVELPSVSSTAPMWLASTKATLSAAVVSDGGAPLMASGFIWGADAELADPTTTAADTANADMFATYLTGLTPETTYYFTSFATNSKGTAYGDTLSFTTPEQVTFDGYTYSLTVLDEEVWFAENLRNTHFANGDPIPHVPGDGDWSTTYFPGYVNPAGDDSSKVGDWGRLYNYYAFEDERGVCPTGWHPSSYSEFNGMRTSIDDAAKFRARSTDAPSWNGTNETYFSAAPVGYRSADGSFSATEGYSGTPSQMFWNNINGGEAKRFKMWDTATDFQLFSTDLASTPSVLRAGNSIRCVKGAPDLTGDKPVVATVSASDTMSTSISLNGDLLADGQGFTSGVGFAWGTDPQLSDAQFIATDATGTTYTLSLEGLEPSTTYYYAAFGRNGYGKSYGDTLSFTTNSWACGSTLEYNGVSYETVEILGDCWFAENLATATFANGDSIATDLSESDWELTLEPAVTGLGSDATEQASYLETYGGLYNFLAVNDARGLCPTGWHVASSTEYLNLVDSLDDPSSASELKAVAPAWNGTNETGLSLLPGGYYRPISIYADPEGELRNYVAQGLDDYTNVWTSTTSSSGSPIGYYIGDFLNGGQIAHLQIGRAVRCVQGDMGPVEVLAPVIQPQHIHVDSLGATAAVVAFGITEDWNNAITEAKVRIGEDRTTTETFTASSVEADTIQIEVTGLLPGTQYWYQPIASSGDATGYGYWQTFTTSADVPAMGTLAATELGPNAATLNGSVDSDGGDELSATGFIWGTTASLDSTTSVAGSSTTGEFTAALTGLEPASTYYYSAFGTNGFGTAYGDTLSFTTPASVVPQITTSAATGITAFTGVLNGAVDYDGGAEVTATGFIWSADSLFTTPQNIAGSAAEEAFSAEITGLTDSTTYYFAAYATNAAGTGYGDTLSFLAVDPPFLCGSSSTVSYQGHAYGTIHRGDQCWFTENLQSKFFTNGDTILYVGTGWSGIGNDEIPALTAYAYDTLNVPTYGWLYNWYAVTDPRGLCPEEWHVSERADWEALRGTLSSSSSGRQLKAKSSDPVPWDGWNSIGFNGLPAGYRTDGGTYNALGSQARFWTTDVYSSVSGRDYRLATGTNTVTSGGDYYNKKGGLSVRCVKYYPATAPVTVSLEAEVLGQTSATMHGTTLADGGGGINQRGFAYSTNSDLSSPSFTTASASGNDFSRTLTTFDVGTTYYYAAYAQNSTGRAYGDTLSFTTVDYIWGCTNSFATNYDPSAEANDGSCTYVPFGECGMPIIYNDVGYNTVQIGSNCWFANNLATTTFADGSEIPHISTAEDYIEANHEPFVYTYDTPELQEVYGALYTHPTVMDGRGLCPSGWEVPGYSDYDELFALAGGPFVAAAALKSSPTDDPSWNGTNDLGFNALPHGMYLLPPFHGLSQVGERGDYWAAVDNWYNTGYWYEGWAFADEDMGGVVNGQIGTGHIEGINVVLISNSDTGYLTYTEQSWVTKAVRCICVDSNNNGICDIVDVQGCTHSGADNYNPGATLDDGSCAFAIFESCGDVVGFDGYGYPTVQIGDQCWFAENLRSEHYADGSSVTDIYDPFGIYIQVPVDSTISGTMPLMREHYTDEKSELFGRMYNHAAAMNPAGLCPSGWHVPTSTEIDALDAYIGGGLSSGLTLLSSSDDDPSWSGSNIYGFTAQQSGDVYRNTINKNWYFDGLHPETGYAAYWMSSPDDASQDNYWRISYGGNLYQSNRTGNYYMGVRCLQD